MTDVAALIRILADANVEFIVIGGIAGAGLAAVVVTGRWLVARSAERLPQASQSDA